MDKLYQVYALTQAASGFVKIGSTQESMANIMKRTPGAKMLFPPVICPSRSKAAAHIKILKSRTHMYDSFTAANEYWDHCRSMLRPSNYDKYTLPDTSVTKTPAEVYRRALAELGAEVVVLNDKYKFNGYIKPERGPWRLLGEDRSTEIYELGDRLYDFTRGYVSDIVSVTDRLVSHGLHSHTAATLMAALGECSPEPTFIQLRYSEVIVNDEYLLDFNDGKVYYASFLYDYSQSRVSLPGTWTPLADIARADSVLDGFDNSDIIELRQFLRSVFVVNDGPGLVFDSTTSGARAQFAAALVGLLRCIDVRYTPYYTYYFKHARPADVHCIIVGRSTARVCTAEHPGKNILIIHDDQMPAPAHTPQYMLSWVARFLVE